MRCALYIQAMLNPVPRPHHRPGAGVFDPFNFAAYITWAAVAFHPLMHYLGGVTWVAPYPTLALLGMAGMLILFLVRAQQDALNVAQGPRRAVILGQTAAALLACWASRDELTPALLVITAAQMATAFSPRGVVVLLLAVNAALALILFRVNEAAVLLIAYAGFQAYTAIGAYYGYRIFEAREDALRINAELMGTRQLLEEGTRADERLRLSRELHDVVGHKLTALKMQLALRRRQSSAPDATFECCERLADELLTDIRGVVTVLRPHEGVDLQRALRALDPGLPRPKVIFDLDPKLRVADMRSAEVLLRCAQEGLTNALRHSSATTVSMSLARTPEGLLLAIADDGNGRAAGLRPGNGLRGLRERLDDVGGWLQVEDRGPSGLVLRAILPASQVTTLAAAEASAAPREASNPLQVPLRAENSAG